MSTKTLQKTAQNLIPNLCHFDEEKKAIFCFLGLDKIPVRAYNEYIENKNTPLTERRKKMTYELQMAIEYGATTEELLALAGVDPEELED